MPLISTATGVFKLGEGASNANVGLTTGQYLPIWRFSHFFVGLHVF